MELVSTVGLVKFYFLQGFELVGLAYSYHFRDLVKLFLDLFLSVTFYTLLPLLCLVLPEIDLVDDIAREPKEQKPGEMQVHHLLEPS